MLSIPILTGPKLDYNC